MSTLGTAFAQGAQITLKYGTAFPADHPGAVASRKPPSSCARTPAASWTCRCIPRASWAASRT
jgi:hypothetical protein